MYSNSSLSGQDMADKTLCLTFDDGPGEHTEAIGQYLYEENIRATFFVVGKYAYQHPEILQKLKDFGHLIANHTYDHPEITYYWAANGDLQNQIIRTDDLIRKYVDSSFIYFRSPYGKWSVETAKELNSDLRSTLNHIGPIHWDIGGIDCYYWSLDRTAEEACDAYLSEIELKHKGIVVFHDDIADMEIVKNKNQTLQLLKLLIPKLKYAGYKFVCLENINSIKNVTEAKQAFFIKTNEFKYLTLTNNKNLKLDYRRKPRSNYLFDIVIFPYGKIAFRILDKYLTLDAQSRLIVAEQDFVTDQSLFDLIPLSGKRFLIRTFKGNYLTFNSSLKQFVGQKPYMHAAQVFLFEPEFITNSRWLAFSQSITRFIKKITYLKSKLEAKINLLRNI